jgi:phage baseplate assembly protein W
MASKKLYKGLSFVNYKNKKTLSLNDLELVKQDILNHIFTSTGERIMMPQFGTRIPDMPFEPLDNFILFQIEEDLRTVIEYDPRVELKTDGGIPEGIRIIPLYDENAIIGVIDLNYIELNLSDVLEIRLEFNT